MTLLRVETEQGEGRVRLALSGELDISTAPQVEDVVARLERDRPALLLIDLRQLEFMDSTGLRTVVGADSRAREQGRRFAVVRGPKAVDRIFAMTGLDERLEMLDEPDGAEPT